MVNKNYNCYIHIPFCRSKCKYCRFASFSGLKKLQVKKYVDILCKEIENSKNYKLKNWKLDTIYFWGWTPAILEKEEFEKIFKTLKNNYIFSENIEITIETTPEEISLEKLKIWKELWINRISIWVQTLNKKALEEVKRDKKWDVEEKLDLLNQFLVSKRPVSQETGLKSPISISLDFIIWLPFVKKWEILENIKYLLKKYDFINHISVYMLEDYYNPSKEKNEKFEQITYPKIWKENSISEEEIWKDYLEIKKYLEKKRFYRYELSNFGKTSPLIPLLKGEGKIKFCKHNKGYWEHKENLAFGLWASWFLWNIRYKNSENFLEYYSWKWKEKEKLSDNDIFLEKLMFSLRTSWFKEDLIEKLNKEKVNYFLENNLLEKKWKNIILSDSWFLYLDYILGEII